MVVESDWPDAARANRYVRGLPRGPAGREGEGAEGQEMEVEKATVLGAGRLREGYGAGRGQQQGEQGAGEGAGKGDGGAGEGFDGSAVEALSEYKVRGRGMVVVLMVVLVWRAGVSGRWCHGVPGEGAGCVEVRWRMGW